LWNSFIRAIRVNPLNIRQKQEFPVMKQRQYLLCYALITVLFGIGCGKANQLANGAIYDAQTQIKAAEMAGGYEYAEQELMEAEQIRARAEELFNAGRENEAYRLGVRAQLKAKVAEAVAVANQMEMELNDVNQKLAEKRQAVGAARRELQQAKQELEELMSMPETN
jgi:hypothetical protein